MEKFTKEKMEEFNKMVEIEPALGLLLEEAMAVKAKDEFCANKAWYGRDKLKGKMSMLVGFGARKEELSGCHAYDVAYDVLYQAVLNSAPSMRQKGGKK